MGQTMANNNLTSLDNSVNGRGNARILQNVLLIWLDQTIDEENNRDCQKNLSQLRRIVSSINTFTNDDQFVNFLSKIKNENACIIISGALGQKTVRRVHDLSQVNSILIFCGDVERHKKWAKDWAKIKGVFNDISPICEALQEAAQQCERNTISMSIMPTNTGGTTTNNKLNSLDPSFMYTQIFKEILLTLEFEKRHFNEFIDFCRKHFTKEHEIKGVENLKQEYRNQTPIWWYTSDSFLYSMLNRALRVMDTDAIINMGFFVSDLHRQLEQLHNLQFGGHRSGNTFTVFRGQGLSKANFKEIQEQRCRLLSFNNFLSTSKSRNVSLGFANRALSDKDSVGILFVMTVDPARSTIPFASINDFSYYGNKEDEMLFSMHTVFRISNIEPLDEKNRLYEIKLTLTSDDDDDCRILTQCIREWTDGSTGSDRLGRLLLKVDQPEKAQQVYESLLEQTTEEIQIGNIYHQLGSAKYQQKNYKEALKFYKYALAIRRQLLPSNHPDLAMSYNNIGNVYGALGKHPKALLSYEKALEIRQQSLPEYHPDLSMSYSNIGSVNCNMGEYSEALWYHEKALNIREKALPRNHPDLAISCNNIGIVHESMGKYSKAQLYYQRAVDIGECSLPPNHPHLQMYKLHLDTIKQML